jgi:cell division protein FtsQ
MLERLRASKDKSGRDSAARSRSSRPQKSQVRPQKPASDGFWHQPMLLNLSADMLIIAASVALAWAAVIALQRLPFYPLREVQVMGELSQVQRSQIEGAARGVVQGNFFTVNIDAARNAFEKLPWVRRAEVRRQWPDRIELRIEEHVPVARWRGVNGEPRLVNSHGEVFAGSIDLPLPLFSGPEGTSAEVLARYKEFESALAKIDLHPRVVALSAREAWQVRLDNGLLLDLGRDQAKLPLAERITRFTEHYPNAIKRSQVHVVAVDMRYPNGFTLRPARNG